MIIYVWLVPLQPHTPFPGPSDSASVSPASHYARASRLRQRRTGVRVHFGFIGFSATRCIFTPLSFTSALAAAALASEGVSQHLPVSVAMSALFRTLFRGSPLMESVDALSQPAA